MFNNNKKYISNYLFQFISKKYITISLVLVIIYVLLVRFANVYYNNNFKILECVNIIGPMKKCVSIYQEGQESIILMYKVLTISSYFIMFINLIFNVYSVILNYKNKQRKTLPIVLTIAFGILTIIFLINLFMK